MTRKTFFTAFSGLLLTFAPAAGEEIATSNLSASERKELNLPLENKLTLATKADVEYVEKLTPETTRAVERFLKPTSRKITVSAARPVGDHLLLWIGFPEILNDGIDLIWSTKEQKSVGIFLGGYRG